MSIKVTVNMPRDMEPLLNLFSQTLAQILVNKLKAEEIDRLVEFLEKDKSEFVKL